VRASCRSAAGAHAAGEERIDDVLGEALARVDVGLIQEGQVFALRPVAGISLHLRAQDDSLALALCSTLAAALPASPRALDEQIRTALEGAGKPLTVADLQRICRVRTSTLCDALAALTDKGGCGKPNGGTA